MVDEQVVLPKGMEQVCGSPQIVPEGGIGVDVGVLVGVGVLVLVGVGVGVRVEVGVGVLVLVGVGVLVNVGVGPAVPSTNVLSNQLL